MVDLIDIINSELTKNDRKKLITLCTIDVHARDVVQRLMDERVENVSCFQWQSQLRYYQNEKTKEAQVSNNCCAACCILKDTCVLVHLLCSAKEWALRGPQHSSLGFDVILELPREI